MITKDALSKRLAERGLERETGQKPLDITEGFPDLGDDLLDRIGGGFYADHFEQAHIDNHFDLP